MWLEYIGEENYHLPPPYNIIQIPFCVYAYFRRKVSGTLGNYSVGWQKSEHLEK